MIIKNITHADMDGAGCSIIMSRLFNDHMAINELDITKTSYNDLKQTITNVVCSSDKDMMVVITDLLVPTAFLKTILEYEHVIKLLYIDHHERFDDRKGLESLKYLHKGKFEYRWKKGFSATSSCYEFSTSHGIPTSKKLDRLVNIIDVFDEWKTTDKNFTEGLGLNEVYWDIGFDKFYNDFYDGLIWTDKMKTFVSEEFKKQDEYFESADEHNIIFPMENGKKILVTFNPKGRYTNLYTLRYDYDLYFMFQYQSNSLKKFNLRSNGKYNCDKIGQDVSQYIDGVVCGGHKCAGGLSVPFECSFERLLEVFMDVVEKS